MPHVYSHINRTKEITMLEYCNERICSDTYLNTVPILLTNLCGHKNTCVYAEIVCWLSNKVDPEKTASRNSMVWIYNVCSGITVRICGVHMVASSSSCGNFVSKSTHCLNKKNKKKKKQKKQQRKHTFII